MISSSRTLKYKILLGDILYPEKVKVMQYQILYKCSRAIANRIVDGLEVRLGNAMTLFCYVCAYMFS